MTKQFELDLDRREDAPDDTKEKTATLSGDALRDLDDEYSSFEDLHYSKGEGGSRG